MEEKGLVSKANHVGKKRSFNFALSFLDLIKVIFICTSAKSDAVGIYYTLDKTSSINFKFKQISKKKKMENAFYFFK